MPNYVHNKVTISGSEEQIYHLEKFVSSHERVFDFNKIIPIKQNERRYLEPAILIWGTKWNSVDPRISHRSENNICYEFETAWGAPFPIYCELSHTFPAMSLEWSYSGIDDPECLGTFTQDDYLHTLKRAVNSD